MLSLIHRSKTLKLIIVLLAVIALVLSLGFSISFGAADIHLSTVWQAIFNFNEDLSSHQVVQELRLPRAFAAVMAGAFYRYLVLSCKV